MATKATSVYAVFKNRAEVERVVCALRDRGFRSDDVSVLLADKASSREFAHEAGTKVPEGAATGGTAGMALGGALGWLAGLGAIAIPGVGPFIAAGPAMGLLAGAGTGGAIGALTGALIGLGIPEYEAKRYEGRLKDGGILVSVHCDDRDWVNRAEEIMKQCDGQDVSSRSEASIPDERTSSTHSRNF